MKRAKVTEKTNISKLQRDLDVMERIVDRAFYMALSMIHIANHKRGNPERGEPKVGGHPSACASSQHILGAIHLALRNPEDYFACKPHVSPIDHAYNYLLHNFRNAEGEPFDAAQRERVMHNLRHYSPEGDPVFQSYHAETDPDSFRYFPSGSVGIPPVNALYLALAYDYAKDHKIELEEEPHFWCLMGDSEFREGSLMEAMPDAGDRQLGNLIWIVDYNRQNLDGTRVLNEAALGGSDADRIARVGEANGWASFILKHGKFREKLFKKPGGQEFQHVLDKVFTDFEFQALLEANRPELTRKVFLEKSKKLRDFLGQLSDEDLQKALFNLGGHDLESLIEVFTQARDLKNKPALIVPYTIKGYHLRCQALSGNHSALPEEDELKEMAERLGTTLEEPFAEFAADSEEDAFLEKRRTFLTNGIEKIQSAVRARQNSSVERAKTLHFPVDFEIGALKFNPVAHTQWMWGQIAAKLDRLGRSGKRTEEFTSENDRAWAEVASNFLTMAPDVGSSTNTSPNMNGKLYGDIGQTDYEKEYNTKDAEAPDVIPVISEKSGHIRFEIAEGNCMSAAGSFGKFFYFTGVPFFPAMTIYDFFIKRALDQYYYNVYWRSHFLTMGTPSGVTLAPEGAQHSWKSDIQMPNSITWEPCFARELEWIMADMLRRHFTLDNAHREATLIRCMTKGLVQKEFLDRLKTQSRFSGQADADIFETIRKDVLEGGYVLIDYRDHEDYTPGDNAVHIFAMGALGAEAIKASDALFAKGILANVFIVTSPDLLLGNAGYDNRYAHLKSLGVSGDLQVRPKKDGVESRAEWLALQGGRVPIVSVHDGEAGLLDNIGSIVGVKHESLAVRKASKSGTTAAIFHLHGIDSEGIQQAVERVLEETAEEQFLVRGEIL